MHGPADGDRLPLASREGFDALAGLSDSDADLGQGGAGVGGHGATVEKTERSEVAHRLPSQVEVAGDVHERDQLQVLVYRLDAKSMRLERRRDLHLLAGEEDLSSGRLVDPGQQLDEGRFASPVVA